MYIVPGIVFLWQNPPCCNLATWKQADNNLKHRISPTAKADSTRFQGVVYIQMGNIRSRSCTSHLPDVRNKLLPQ